MTGDLLLSCSVDKTVRFWDVRSNKSIKMISSCLDDLEPTCGAFSIENTNYVSISAKEFLHIFDLRMPEVILNKYTSVWTL